MDLDALAKIAYRLTAFVERFEPLLPFLEEAKAHHDKVKAEEAAEEAEAAEQQRIDDEAKAAQDLAAAKAGAVEHDAKVAADAAAKAKADKPPVEPYETLKPRPGDEAEGSPADATGAESGTETPATGENATGEAPAQPAAPSEAKG